MSNKTPSELVEWDGDISAKVHAHTPGSSTGASISEMLSKGRRTGEVVLTAGALGPDYLLANGAIINSADNEALAALLPALPVQPDSYAAGGSVTSSIPLLDGLSNVSSRLTYRGKGYFVIGGATPGVWSIDTSLNAVLEISLSASDVIDGACQLAKNSDESTLCFVRYGATPVVMTRIGDGAFVTVSIAAHLGDNTTASRKYGIFYANRFVILGGLGDTNQNAFSSDGLSWGSWRTGFTTPDFYTHLGRVGGTSYWHNETAGEIVHTSVNTYSAPMGSSVLNYAASGDTLSPFAVHASEQHNCVVAISEHAEDLGEGFIMRTFSVYFGEGEGSSSRVLEYTGGIFSAALPEDIASVDSVAIVAFGSFVISLTGDSGTKYLILTTDKGSSFALIGQDSSISGSAANIAGSLDIVAKYGASTERFNAQMPSYSKHELPTAYSPYPGLTYYIKR